MTSSVAKDPRRTDPDDGTAVTRAFSSFLSTELSPQTLRNIASAGGFDDQLWKRFVDMGGVSASLPSAMGGDGGSMVDAVRIGVEVGHALAPFPYADGVAAARLFGRQGTVALLRRALAGEVVCDAVDSPPSVKDGRRLAAYGRVASMLIARTRADATLIDLGGSGLGPALPNLASTPMGTVPSGIAESPCATGASLHQYEADRFLLSAATLVGAGRLALDLTLTHIRSRVAFDKPLGAFQAIQHRLADLATSLQAADLLVVATARAIDFGQPPLTATADALVALRSAVRSAEEAGRLASQFHGGYGFTLEYDVHLVIRYVKSVASFALPTEDECVERLIRLAAPSRPGPSGPGTVVPTGAPGTFRREIEEFLAEALDEDLAARCHVTGTNHDPDFLRRLADKGWLGLGVSKALGGADLSAFDQYEYWEVMNYYAAPIDGQMFVEMLSGLLAQVGTEAQRDLLLNELLAGEWMPAIGYTEPGSGSDVAAASTRATRTSNGYVVNGAKMFTTMAETAKYVLILARTESSLPKHAGLSLLLVPTDDPGVVIHEVKTFGGERTNATFYNDVFVPEALRVGLENDGWRCAVLGLNFERAIAGGYIGRVRRLLDDLIHALGDPEQLSTLVKGRLIDFACRIDEAAALCRNVYKLMEANLDISVAAAMAKVAATETLRDLAYQAVAMLGPLGLLTEESADAPRYGHIEHSFRHSHVTTVYGGASEVQRHIIATRGLRLPMAA